MYVRNNNNNIKSVFIQNARINIFHTYETDFIVFKTKKAKVR